MFAFFKPLIADLAETEGSDAGVLGGLFRDTFAAEA